MTERDDMGAVQAGRGSGAGRADESGGARLTDDEVMRAVPPRAGAREFRVGVFFIFGIAGFLAVLFLMTNPALFRGRYMIETEVPDAQGIRRGDPVRMQGVNIGRVYDFGLADDGDVRVILEVERDYPIPGPASTELLSQGILGGMVVSVIPGPGPGIVRGGAVLPGVTVEGVMEAADGVTEQVSEVMGQVQGLLADSTVAQLAEGVEAFRDVLQDLAAVTEGQEAELEALTESLRRSAANVEELTGSDDWSRALASAERSLATVERTSAALESSLRSLDTVLGRMERGEGTLGRLSATDDMHVSVDSTLASLRHLLNDIRENPGRYVTIEIF